MCLSLWVSRSLSLCPPPPNTHSPPTHLTDSILDRWQALYVVQFPCSQWMEGNDHFSKVSLGYKVWSLLCVINFCEPVNLWTAQSNPFWNVPFYPSSFSPLYSEKFSTFIKSNKMRYDHSFETLFVWLYLKERRKERRCQLLEVTTKGWPREIGMDAYILPGGQLKAGDAAPHQGGGGEVSGQIQH